MLQHLFELWKFFEKQCTQTLALRRDYFILSAQHYIFHTENIDARVATPHTPIGRSDGFAASPCRSSWHWSAILNKHKHVWSQGMQTASASAVSSLEFWHLDLEKNWTNPLLFVYSSRLIIFMHVMICVTHICHIIVTIMIIRIWRKKSSVFSNLTVLFNSFGRKRRCFSGASPSGPGLTSSVCQGAPSSWPQLRQSLLSRQRRQSCWKPTSNNNQQSATTGEALPLRSVESLQAAEWGSSGWRSSDFL